MCNRQTIEHRRKKRYAFSYDERAAIEIVLEERYTNGCRLDIIELNRLRLFICEYADNELTLTDNELIEAVKSCGIFFDNKVYVIKKETRNGIERQCEDYFRVGGKVIFYEEFYAKNVYWLSEANVISKDVLKHILRQLFPDLVFTNVYFGYTSENINSVVVSEIVRIWGDDILLDYERISQRLKYIPLKRIEFALGQNAEFIWNSVSCFVHVNRIDVNDEEKVAVREVAEKECNMHHYISAIALPLGDFTERNHELSSTAVQTAVFQLYLADSFERRGKIITRKGVKLSALEIMQEYCRSLERISLAELLAFEFDLTGENHRWIPMQAGYDVMVRISEDVYIAEKHVKFNVRAVDEAIEHFIHGEYAPLRTVVTFALFPHCGQAWNLFLLESYLRRFSELFRFECPSVNNKNAGCIVRKKSKLDYTDIMADAIAKSNVSLNENDIADFLFETGYRGSRQKAKLADLIRRAKSLRESRD
jgi:hypothetical protein